MSAEAVEAQVQLGGTHHSLPTPLVMAETELPHPSLALL